MRVEVGERIKQAWERAGFKNQRQAAQALGWSAQRLSNYIVKGRVPDVAALQHMAATFGVPASWFISENDDKGAALGILLKLFDLMGIDQDEARIFANVYLESLELYEAQQADRDSLLDPETIVQLLWKRQLSQSLRK